MYKWVEDISGRVWQFDEVELLSSLGVDLLLIVSDLIGEAVLHEHFFLIRVGCETFGELEQSLTSFELNLEKDRDLIIRAVIESERESSTVILTGAGVAKQIDCGVHLVHLYLK